MGFDPKAHKYESRWADAGGIKTHYIEAGRGEPVVLIHGGGPGADGTGNWYSTLPLLAEKNRVIAVDMLGFGQTAKPDAKTFTYSQDARTSHLIAFVEALGLKSVSLVGNSMGGITSLSTTIRRPHLVKKLVLMGSAGIASGGIPAALGPLMAYDGTEEAMKKVVRALTHPEFAMDDGMVRYRVEMSNSPGTREALGATMGWVKSQGGLFLDENEIRKVKTPTLVVGGKNDPIVPLDNNMKFLELIEHSWGYFIPRTGHWVMIERPEEFAAVTARFLSS